MSTSVQVSYIDGRDHFSFTRRACFGTANRISSTYRPELMQNFEWHPDVGSSQDDTASIKKAFDIINSFGMWNDVFWMTPADTVAADVRVSKADQAITGLMAMRDIVSCYYPMFLGGEELIDKRIDMLLSWLGFYMDRYHQTRSLQQRGQDNNESSVIMIYDGMDAFALNLLINGTKEDFEGCWVQGLMGVGHNDEGYLRNGSNQLNSFRRTLHDRGALYGSMADWLRYWLSTSPPQFAGKLGRLTVNQFCDRIKLRCNGIMTPEEIRLTLRSMFEEMKDMYL